MFYGVIAPFSLVCLHRGIGMMSCRWETVGLPLMSYWTTPRELSRQTHAAFTGYIGPCQLNHIIVACCAARTADAVTSAATGNAAAASIHRACPTCSTLKLSVSCQICTKLQIIEHSYDSNMLRNHKAAGPAALVYCQSTVVCTVSILSIMCRHTAPREAFKC